MINVRRSEIAHEHHGAMRVALAALLTGLAVSGCAQQDGSNVANSAPAPSTASLGDPAVWDLAAGQHLTQASTRFTALVTRMACHGGVTGEVFAPEVRVNEAQIIVTFSVAPSEPGNYFCQGNDPVPYEVFLPEALGNRVLIDGECREHDGASSTTFCLPDGTRFRP